MEQPRGFGKPDARENAVEQADIVVKKPLPYHDDHHIGGDHRHVVQRAEERHQLAFVVEHHGQQKRDNDRWEYIHQCVLQGVKQRTQRDGIGEKTGIVFQPDVFGRRQRRPLLQAVVQIGQCNGQSEPAQNENGGKDKPKSTLAAPLLTQ